MASRSGSCRATSAVRPGSRSCKAAASAISSSKSDSKSNELGAPKKGTSAFSHTSAPSHTNASSHANAPTPVELTLALKYSKADLIKILKIFLETKSQEPKAEIPRKG